VPRRKPPRVPISRKKKKVSTRRITYNVQAIQSLRNVDIPRRTTLQSRAIRNRAAMATAYNQNIESMTRFGRNYVTGMAAFNLLPQVVSGLAERPLQAMVTHGPTALQRTILQGIGVKMGPGAARAVDEMLRGGVNAVTGGISKFPALNIGSGYLFADAPREALNIPENRPQWTFGGGGQPSSVQHKPQGWNIGR